MEKGKIIFLNGVSSAGKSTIAITLQERLGEVFFSFGIDTFIDMCPQKHISYRHSDSGAVLNKAISIIPELIKLYSDKGYNLIVDHVLGTPRADNEGVYEFVELLHDYPVLFVHVTCPVEELRRRERKRGDRTIGLAESQLSTLFPQDTYDLTVDTFHNSKKECTDKIITLMNQPEKFMAFKTLWAQRIK
jgi:chloramphenicol 3-O-phosphotransferase